MRRQPREKHQHDNQHGNEGDESALYRLPRERDPLQDLKDHPLFRDLVPSGPSPLEAPSDRLPSGDGSRQALRVALSELRRARARIAELETLLEASEAARRQLIRRLDSLECRIRQADKEQVAEGTKPEPANLDEDLTRWEALFTGELPADKITLNGIPSELKAFLTATKAEIRAQTGAMLSERDQVIFALAAYRLILETLPDRQGTIRRLVPKDRQRFAARFFAFLLGWLQRRIGAGGQVRHGRPHPGAQLFPPGDAPGSPEEVVKE